MYHQRRSKSTMESSLETRSVSDASTSSRAPFDAALSLALTLADHEGEANPQFRPTCTRPLMQPAANSSANFRTADLPKQQLPTELLGNLVEGTAAVKHVPVAALLEVEEGELFGDFDDSDNECLKMKDELNTSSSHSPLRDVRTQQFYSKTESVQGNAANGVTKLIMQQPHKNIQTDVLSANTSPVMIVNTDCLHRSTSFYKEESSASKLLVCKPKIPASQRSPDGHEHQVNRMNTQENSKDEYTVKVLQLVPEVTKRMLQCTFNKIGLVKCIRLITSNPHNYAYVHYVKQKDAYSAVEKLNGSVLCGHPIHVYIHQGNTHAHHPAPKQYTVKVKHLSGRVTENELLELFSAHGIVEDLKVNKVPDSHNYAYVNYANLEGALTAVEKLNGIKLYGAAMTVILHNRCTDKYPRQSQLGSGRTELHIVKVENIPGWITKENLECKFRLYGPVSKVELLETPEPFNHAYIHFYKQEDASKALEEINREGINIGQRSVHLCVTAVSTKRRKVETIDNDTREELLNKEQLHTDISIANIIASQTNVSKAYHANKTFNHVQHFYDEHKILPQTNSTETDVQYSQRCNSVHSLPLITTNATPQSDVSSATKNKSISNIEMKTIPCTPLVGKVLFTHYPDEIREVRLTSSVEPNELYSELILSGSAKQVELAEHEIKQVLQKVESSIEKKQLILPCHYLPLLSSNSLEDKVTKIESKHLVHFKVLNDCNAALSISECIKSLHSIIKSKKDAVETEQLSPLLHKQEPTMQCIGAQCHSWLWEDDFDGYTKYSQDVTNNLTKQFILSETKPLILKIGSNKYIINFSAMKQVNVKTRYVRKLKHLVNHSDMCDLNPERCKHSSSHMLCIEIEGHKHCLEKAISDLKSAMETSIFELRFKMNLKSSVILEVTDLYCIEAQTVGGELVLRGAEDYIDKVTIQVQKACIMHMSSTLATISRPSHWVPQTEKVLLYGVCAGTPEWNEVISLVHHTLPTANVVKLVRIQNVWLWEKYSFTKERLIKKNGQQSLNERRLFHGTNNVAPEKIYKSEQGFDFRCSSESNLWGSGTYFAVNASYSDSYSHNVSTNRKQMFLADVLTGVAFKCPPDQTLKKPPQKPFSDGDLYDSVTGSTNGSDIFVIYELDKAYPAYLITYHCA